MSIVDWLTAPFGSAEDMLLTYGLPGVDHTLDESGRPVATQRASPDVDAIGWKYISQRPQVMTWPAWPDYARVAYDFERMTIPVGISDPTLGVVSQTNFALGLEPHEVVDVGNLDRVQVAAFQLDGHVLLVTNVGDHPVEVGPTALPVIGVSGECELSPGMRSFTTNGPVPTIEVFASGPSTLGLSQIVKISRPSKNPGRDTSVVISTVYLSGVAIVVNQLLMPVRMPLPTDESRGRSKLYLTSSLVYSRAMWYCAPLRMLSLKWVKSELKSQLWASTGCGSRFASYAVRRLNTSQLVSMALVVTRYGSSVATSAVVA